VRNLIFRLVRLKGEPAGISGPLRLATSLAFAVLLLISSGAGQAPMKKRVLRTLREANQLSSIEARNVFPVDVQGVATYVDPEWGLLFLQDETGAIYVNVHGMTSLCPVGSRIHITAVTGAGDVGTVLESPHIECLGTGVLPTAERRSLAEISSKLADSRYVQTEGVLRPGDQSWPRICYRIVDGNSAALVVLPQASDAQSQRMLGASVRVRGVSGVQIDSKGKVVGSLLFVNRMDDIQVAIAGGQSANTLAVVVNKGNPVNDLSQAELRQILLGTRLYWNGAQKIVLLLPKVDTPERETMLRLLGLNESAYENHWSEAAKQGEVSTPPVAASCGLAVNVVAENPQAIAIVSAADVKSSVKVISIDGHMPRDTAYAIH
jgi:phosphate transport system substrate-binding protein